MQTCSDREGNGLFETVYAETESRDQQDDRQAPDHSHSEFLNCEAPRYDIARGCCMSQVGASPRDPSGPALARLVAR